MTSLRNDFEEFSQSVERPPLRVSEKVLAHVRHELNPSLVSVLMRLMFVHFLASFATLSVCPQFGFRLFGEGMGISHWFMSFGEYGCLVACGSFFTGTSLALASVVLGMPHLRKIREHRWLGASLLILFSLSFFWMMNAEFILGLTVAWLLGALLGSVAVLELGWLFRRKSLAHG